MADPNIIDHLWCQFRDGELSLDELGAGLVDQGFTPQHVRQTLSEETKYPIPVHYFGIER